MASNLTGSSNLHICSTIALKPIMDKITDAMTSQSLVDINTITDNNTADDMKELCSTIDTNLLHFVNLKIESLTEVFKRS